MTNTNNHKTELPAGWVWTKVDELISEQGVFCDGDWVESKDQDPNGDVRLIQLADVGDGSFKDKSNRFLTSEKARELNCTYLEKGDILVARLPDPLGRACIFPLEGKGKYVTVVDVCIVRPETNDINSKYLLYVINSPQTRTEVDKYKSGSTRKRISRTNFARIEFPLPPLAEQQRIVDKIEELFSDLDHSVAALETTRAQLDIYRQAVLKHAFEGKLTEAWRQQHQPPPAADLLAHIQTERQTRYQQDLDTWQAAVAAWESQGKPGRKPSKPKKPKDLPPLAAAELAELPSLPEGWKWVRVEQLGEVKLGRQRAPQHHNGPFMRPYLRVANVFEDRIDTSDVLEMNFTPKEFEIFQLKYGDILLNEGQSLELVGRPAMYRDEVPGACFQNTLVRFRSYYQQTSKYALRLFQHYLHTGRFQRIAKITTSIAHLGASRFAELEFPLPPLPEQRAIVDEIEARLSVVDKLAETIDTALQQAEALRQSILKQAFAGKLVPQNADDEPAGVLLERIKRP